MPGFKELRENHERESRERREARQQAFQAAHAAADGKTRGQVRDLFLAELRIRGLDEARDAILEATVDLMTGHPATASGRMLLRYAKDVARLLKWFWSAVPSGP